MKNRPVYAATFLLIAALVVLMVSFLGQRSVSGKTPGARRVQYYTCPMHPSYRSDSPGTAPCCGMKLEPVYADDAPAEAPHGQAGRAAVALSPEKQTRIGVQVAEAEETPATRTVRLFGRVAPDETRIYKLVSGMEGVVRKTSAVTTGSRVREGQWLATFSAPELRAPLQGYVVALDVADRQREGGAQAPSQIQAAKESVQQALDRLLNLGMSTRQLAEVMRTRAVPTDLMVYAPAGGIVVSRAVSNGQRFDKGVEWFRIADLSRVWVTADVFENDTALIRPGRPAHVTLRDGGATAAARVSEVLPEFDAGSRTLKVRFEVENPGYSLRPDMLVDVHLSATLPPAIAVPEGAVLDSGARKTIFVETGSGRFETREVRTGWQFDGRVQIIEGLQPGERFVTAGNFFLDSETRLQSGSFVK